MASILSASVHAGSGTEKLAERRTSFTAKKSPSPQQQFDSAVEPSDQSRALYPGSKHEAFPQESVPGFHPPSVNVNVSCFPNCGVDDDRWILHLLAWSLASRDDE